MKLARLYAIVDAQTLQRRGMGLRSFAEQLRDAGVGLVQYRDKAGGPQEVLRACAEIGAVFAGTGATLILNDRADLAVLAGWGGVHVGQGDLPVDAVRKVMGAAGVVGLSTHSAQQVAAADQAAPEYVAIGPVFGTTTKLDADPVVGLEGVRLARRLTARPLVAIGGITLGNCRSVVAARADSVAVITGLMVDGRSVRDVARDFLEILG